MKTVKKFLFPDGIPDDALQLAYIALELIEVLSEQELSLMEKTDAVAEIFQLP